MFIGEKLARLNPLVTFLGFLDTSLIIPVIALYAKSLGADIRTIGIIVGTYSITNVFTNVLGGRWSDKYGYKLPLIIGLCGDALAIFLYTLCQTPTHLALVRAIHGLSGGLIGPATMSFTASQASYIQKGKAMSIYGAAIAMATLVGFGTGGTIASHFGFDILFYVGSCLLIIGVILASVMPPVKSIGSRQSQQGYPAMNFMKLLGRGSLSIPYLSIFAQYFSFGGIVALLPLFVTTLNMGSFHVGMLLAIFSLMFITIQLISGTIVDRVGRLKPTSIALSIGISALALLSYASSFTTLALVMAVYGVAYGLLFPAISALLVDNTSPQEYGVATGVFHAIITAGVAVGAPIMGWIAGYTGVKIGLTIIFIIFIPPLILALINLRLGRKYEIIRQ